MAAPTPASCSRIASDHGAWRDPRRDARCRACSGDPVLGPRFRARAAGNAGRSCSDRWPSTRPQPGCAGLLLARGCRRLHRSDDRRRHPPRAAGRGTRRATVTGDVLDGRLSHQPGAPCLRRAAPPSSRTEARVQPRHARAGGLAANAVRAAACGARVWPARSRAVIRYAGDAPRLSCERCASLRRARHR